jgi:hypothetical protein
LLPGCAFYQRNVLSFSDIIHVASGQTDAPAGEAATSHLHREQTE